VGILAGSGSSTELAPNRDSGGAWIWCGAGSRCDQRGGEPGRAEKQLCRPMGQGLGRLAILLVDRGVEKPSTI
jgi:hypothetical protein